MTVLKWSAPFALAIALAASPAMAEETPHATVLDHRVREVNYNDRQVYEIPGVFRIATEIVFAKDEVVEHVALGDTVSWDCLLYTSPSPRDKRQSRMPSSA